MNNRNANIPRNNVSYPCYFTVAYSCPQWTGLKIPSCLQLNSFIVFIRNTTAIYFLDLPIWQKFKPIQAFMVVLVTFKNEEDPFKNEGTRVVTRFLTLLCTECLYAHVHIFE